MGIRHLITFLQPYASSEPLAGRAVVIDGPAFAYHVYHVCLSATPHAKNALEAAPSYDGLQKAVVLWLDTLQRSNVEVKMIYFDGFLPSGKMMTRLGRLSRQTEQISQFHNKTKWPCRATFPRPENVPHSLFSNSPIRSSLTTLPPLPFLVPAVIEVLKNNEQYSKIIQVVPGEADLYCARYLKEHGGLVITGDSDLLVHDLGSLGEVCFLKTIEPCDVSEPHSLSAQIYQPAGIARRLKLPMPHGLRSLAFEISEANYETFRKLLGQAQSLHAVNTAPEAYTEFLKEFSELPTQLSPPEAKFQPYVHLIQTLDPRISEYVLQFPYIARISGQGRVEVDTKSTYHMFLPILIDCPVRTDAWEISTAIRQLAYGLINMSVPEVQRQASILEHRSRSGKNNGRELQLPTKLEILAACEDILHATSNLRENFPALTPEQIWTAIAIQQDIEYADSYGKSIISSRAINQLEELASASVGHETFFGWDIIHFLAQIQGSFYSFRILQQILDVVMSDSSVEHPPSFFSFQAELKSLPTLAETCDLTTASSFITKLDDDGNPISAIKTVLTTLDPPLRSKTTTTTETGAKKRKRDRLSAASPARGRPNNPFALLEMD